MTSTSYTETFKVDSRDDGLIEISFELDIAISGETRTVSFVRIQGQDAKMFSAWSEPIAAGRIGSGAKLWRVCLIAWFKEDRQRWVWNGQCSVAHNRQVNLVTWADSVKGSAHGARTNSYAALS